MNLNKLRKNILIFLYSQGWRYLARDKFMNLRVYRYKPIKLENLSDWGGVGINSSGSVTQFSNLFKDVHWEDKEPLSIEKELGVELLQNVSWDDGKLVNKRDKGIRRYLVDLCNYIDWIFSIVFIISFIRWLFGIADDQLTMYISLVGVLVWPNKKHWAQWLNVDLEEYY